MNAGDVPIITSKEHPEAACRLDYRTGGIDAKATFHSNATLIDIFPHGGMSDIFQNGCITTFHISTRFTNSKREHNGIYPLNFQPGNSDNRHGDRGSGSGGEDEVHFLYRSPGAAGTHQGRGLEYANINIGAGIEIGIEQRETRIGGATPGLSIGLGYSLKVM